MKKYAFLLMLVFAAITGFAQQGYYTVYGNVTEHDTKAPMTGASVFAQNTTFGTVTDAAGNFKLQLPNGGYDLVITFTGYETESMHITTSAGEQKIELKQKDKTLEAVAVVASSEVKDGWEKYGDFFQENFIGKTLNSKNCIIKNKEVLKFFFSKRKNRLKIISSEPLVIENNALGYRVKYALDSFLYEYDTKACTYIGYPLFEEMKAGTETQAAEWNKKRLVAYNGSLLHLMRSIYTKDLKKQGFEIQFLVDNNGKDEAISPKSIYAALNYDKDDSTHTVEITPNQKKLAILYNNETTDTAYLAANPGEPVKFQLSYIFFVNAPSIVIEENGYHFDQNDIIVNGWMAWEKVADMLPYDFKQP
ncbi:MAG: carboxypeptidase-like regulatory domain-containing protein [Ferruginibacter sp.]